MTDDDSSLQDDDGSSKSSEGKQNVDGGGTKSKSDFETIKTLRKQVHHWRATATALSKLLQSEKDALIANFTTLRNQLETRHREKIESIQREHDAEKRIWEAQLEAAGRVGTNTKKRRLLPIEDLVDPVKESKELFSGEVAAALAAGRRIPTNITEARQPILAATEAVDMEELLREERAYNEGRRNRVGQRKTKNRQGETEEEGNRGISLENDQKLERGEFEIQKRPKKGQQVPPETKSPNRMDTDPAETVDPMPENPLAFAGDGSSKGNDKTASISAGDNADSDSDEWTLRRPLKG